MARKVQVVIEDDIDGSPAVETVVFGLDGKTYEIDLSEENAAALRASFAQWIASARLSSGRAPSATRKSAGAAAAQAKASVARDTGKIRDWARAAGIQVNERGRLSSEVIAKYEAAHSA